MKLIKQFQVRGIPGEVTRITMGERTIDYWAPTKGTDSVLITHDGQNVFDGKTSTRRNRTWEIGQSVNRVSRELGVNTPAVIAIWNGSTKENPWARALELSPEKIFKGGIKAVSNVVVPFSTDDLYGDRYLHEIFNEQVPEILEHLSITTSPEKTAMIGSSMGGLATLYALSQYRDRFNTALALSTHWSIGENPLVDALIASLPDAGKHQIYMSRGTKGLDAAYEPFQKRADALMLEKGYSLNRDYMTRVHVRTGHSEKSWASFIDEPISFWLKASA